MLLVYMMGKLRHEEQKFVVTEWRNQVFIVYFVHEPWSVCEGQRTPAGVSTSTTWVLRITQGPRLSDEPAPLSHLTNREEEYFYKGPLRK